MFANMKIKRFKLRCLLALFSVASSCVVDHMEASAGTSFPVTEFEVTGQQPDVEQILSRLTLEEKICQLFILTPEELTGTGTVTIASDRTREAIHEKPIGGIIYMPPNLESREQISEMLERTQQFSIERIGLPMLLAVDEEGGSVRRINGRGIIGGAEIPSMQYIGSTGDVSAAYAIGIQMGQYLSELGFNTDFAPVADVLTNPENNVVRDRSFGSDPELVSDMAVSFMNGLREYRVIPTLKHFPGHGSTSEDSHEEYAISYQTLDELMSEDLAPYIKCISIGTEMIMAGHISLPNVTGNMMPASMNPEIINGLLRDKLGYDGVVITDALNMGAITEHYDSADAAVAAIAAGCDILLMPSDWYSAYDGVLMAVENGALEEERIDESVRRIIALKLQHQQ